jgi:peptide/nickel transport system substrate-binding protein
MRHSVYPFLVVSSVALTVALAGGATRPRYGGTLRVEIQARVMKLDPVEWPELAAADTALKLRELIYDRLVRLDIHGQPQPSIAISWEHDATSAKWQLKLRSGVKWQDGSALTPFEILSALEGMAPGGSVRLQGDTLEINMGRSRPDLLLSLAKDPAWAIRRPAVDTAEGLPIGTGPFRLTEWTPGSVAVFQANDNYWDGRPFVDKIEVKMGRSSRDQLLDLEFGKVDLVELDPGEARRAQQEGKKVWNSAPLELLFLRWDLNKPEALDRRLREAVADSIDRAAIQKVLAQNYGEAAGGILPQWLSGYSFLFPTTPDLNRARQLTAEMGTTPTLRLGYDASDALAHQTAERIAVNARDAGITLQVSPLPEGWRRMPDSSTDLRLERARIDGPTFATAVLEGAHQLGLQANGSAENPERVYEAERKLLEPLAEVPLVYIPELTGVGARVKDWSPMPWGDWRLQDIWLEAEKP